MASKRKPSGTPAGGQYATSIHAESDTPLDPGPSERHDLHGGLTEGGDEMWRLPDGVLHRDPTEGPAVQYNGGIKAGGGEMYFVHGVVHRNPTEGPAVQWAGGVAAGGSEQFWVEGVRVDPPI